MAPPSDDAVGLGHRCFTMMNQNIIMHSPTPLRDSGYEAEEGCSHQVFRCRSAHRLPRCILSARQKVRAKTDDCLQLIAAQRHSLPRLHKLPKRSMPNSTYPSSYANMILSLLQWYITDCCVLL